MGMVGPKIVVSAASAIVRPASTFLAKGHGRNTATAIATETMPKEIKIRTERLDVEQIGAGFDLVSLLLIAALVTVTAFVTDCQVILTAKPLVI
jgi:hypothetical protein